MASNLTPEEEQRLTEVARKLRENKTTEFPFGPDAIKDIAGRVMRAGSEIVEEISLPSTPSTSSRSLANRNDYRLLLRQDDNSYLHRIAETGRSWSELVGGRDPGEFIIFVSTYGSEIIRSLGLPSSTDGKTLIKTVVTKFAQKLGFLKDNEELDPSNPRMTRQVRYPQYPDSEVELIVKHPSQPYIYTAFTDNDPLFPTGGGFTISFDRQA